MSTLKYTAGWKYQCVEDITFQLRYDFGIKENYSCQYYSITTDGRLTVYAGCCWDGPTWFPDFEWMMKPSLVHDVLHWLIAEGVIGEWANGLIDAELAYWIEQHKGLPMLYLMRARYVKRATSFCFQKKGDKKPVYEVE